MPVLYVQSLEEIWPDSESSDEEIQSKEGKEVPPTSSLIWQFVFFLFYWQAVYKISNAAIKCLLKFSGTLCCL